MKHIRSHFFIFFIAFIVFGNFADAQSGEKMDYAKTVELLERGNTDIDYSLFRKSFFESSQYTYKKAHQVYFDSLKMEMEILAKNNKYFEVIKLGKEILKMDYTNIPAHQYLRQMFSFIHDSTREVKHKSIQYGLLRSMIGKGDGLTCVTAWEVYQTEEEYAILAMIGTKSIEHEIVDNNNAVCDKIRVETKDGKEKIYYFRIQKIKVTPISPLPTIKRR